MDNFSKPVLCNKGNFWRSAPIHSMSTTWFMNDSKWRRPDVADYGGNVRVSFGSCPWNCAGRRKAIPRSPEKTLHQWRIQQVGTTKKKDSNPCTCPHSTFFFSIRYMLEWPSLSKMIYLPLTFIKEIYGKNCNLASKFLPKLTRFFQKLQVTFSGTKFLLSNISCEISS